MNKNCEKEKALQHDNLYCLCKNFEAYYYQCSHEEKADFGAPCADCALLDTCKGNWIDKILPILEIVDIRLKLCRPAQKLKLDIVRDHLNFYSHQHNRKKIQFSQLNKDAS